MPCSPRSVIEGRARRAVCTTRSPWRPVGVRPRSSSRPSSSVRRVDLDTFGLADPAFDAASLVARLQALPKHTPVTRESAEAAAVTFTDRYFRLVPRGWQETFALNYARAALKVAVVF